MVVVVSLILNPYLQLYEKVKLSSERLSHSSWVAHMQRVNMDGLLSFASSSALSPAVCCQRANMLEQTAFQDGYKHLNYQEVSLGKNAQTRQSVVFD